MKVGAFLGLSAQRLFSALLCQDGVVVLCIDTRGWGHSDGESMYMNNMETFAEDIKAVYDILHT